LEPLQLLISERGSQLILPKDGGFNPSF